MSPQTQVCQSVPINTAISDIRDHICVLISARDQMQVLIIDEQVLYPLKHDPSLNFPKNISIKKWERTIKEDRNYEPSYTLLLMCFINNGVSLTKLSEQKDFKGSDRVLLCQRSL